MTTARDLMVSGSQPSPASAAKFSRSLLRSPGGIVLPPMRSCRPDPAPSGNCAQPCGRLTSRDRPGYRAGDIYPATTGGALDEMLPLVLRFATQPFAYDLARHGATTADVSQKTKEAGRKRPQSTYDPFTSACLRLPLPRPLPLQPGTVVSGPGGAGTPRSRRPASNFSARSAASSGLVATRNGYAPASHFFMKLVFAAPD